MMRNLLCMYTIALSLFTAPMAADALRAPGPTLTVRGAPASGDEPPDQRPGDPPPTPEQS